MTPLCLNMNISPDSILKKLLLKEDLFTKRKTLEATISCIKRNKNVDLNRETLKLKKEKEALLREITSLKKILKNKTKVLQVRLEKIDISVKIAVKTKNSSAQKNSSRKYDLRRPSQMQAAQKFVFQSVVTPRIAGTTNESLISFAGKQLTPQQFNALRQQALLKKSQRVAPNMTAVNDKKNISNDRKDLYL